MTPAIDVVLKSSSVIFPAPFIVGVGRSGTTLLRLMLDAHPELCIPPETGFIPAAMKSLCDAADPRHDFAKVISEFETWPDFNLSPQRLYDALKFEPSELPAWIRAFYRLYAARFAKTRWGDKTPVYSRHMTQIETILPEARFIHLIRDGRDVALSVRPLWFAPGKDIESLARDWKRRIEETRELSRNCAHYLEIHYEALVTRPEAELRKICAFIHLDYHPQMLEYFKKARHRLDEIKPRYRPDKTLLISKEERLFNQRFTSSPPDRSRIFRWKNEMSKEEQREFETEAGDLLQDLGYETFFLSR
jgi:Sulfotransferase family